MRELNRRHAWTSSTFPAQVQLILERLQTIVARRKSLFQSSTALWNEQSQDRTSRTGHRLPVGEFCDTLVPDLELFRELQAQVGEQRLLIDQLRV